MRASREPEQKKPKDDKDAKIKEEMLKNKKKLSKERTKIYGQAAENKQSKKTNNKHKGTKKQQYDDENEMYKQDEEEEEKSETV